jgi:hypothetical protein
MPSDQAEGLRRLFGTGRLRVLPILLDDPVGAAQADWLAALLLAVARRGARVVVCDGTRAGLAARLGLRARFDLLHALHGDCAPARVRLVAGDGLILVPAARACDAAAQAGARLSMLWPAWAGLQPACDLLVPLLHVRHAALLAHQPEASGPFDVLAPMCGATGGGAAGATVVPAIARLAAFWRGADIGVFRLLFPGMDPSVVATLATGFTASARRARLPIEIPTSIALAAAGDPDRVAAALAGWQVPVLRPLQVPAASEENFA